MEVQLKQSKETNCNPRFFEGWIENVRYQQFYCISQVYLDKKKVTNRNKPWIYIFLAIHGKDFICKLLDFGDVFILNKKKHILGRLFKSWICFIKTRNSVNVIKSKFHAFPI